MRAKRRRVVLLNSPPGGGKDTAGQFLANKYFCRKIQFKDRLLDIALTVSGMGEEEWWHIYNNRDGTSSPSKDTPLYVLGGLSQREFLIEISEKWVKPRFGGDYFGKVAAKDIFEDPLHHNFVFTDSGFVEEAVSLFRVVGSGDVLLVRITRPGCTFEGDSRDWLPLEMFDNYVTVSNATSLEDFERNLYESVGWFLDREDLPVGERYERRSWG